MRKINELIDIAIDAKRTISNLSRENRKLRELLDAEVKENEKLKAQLETAEKVAQNRA
jgi:hypothetical protein